MEKRRTPIIFDPDSKIRLAGMAPNPEDGGLIGFGLLAKRLGERIAPLMPTIRRAGSFANNLLRPRR